jgi:hypothetical protein
MEPLAKESNTDSSIAESFNCKDLRTSDLNDLMKRDNLLKTMRPHESFVYKLGYELAFDFIQSSESRSSSPNLSQESVSNTSTFKFNLKKCHLCNFQSESRLVIDQHLAEPHATNCIKCAFCSSFRTKSKPDYREHLFKVHNRVCKMENPLSKQMCSICDYECKNDQGKLSKHVHFNCQFREINLECNELIRSQLNNPQAPTQVNLLDYEFMFDLKQPSYISKLIVSKPSFFENKSSAYETYGEYNDIKMYKSLISEDTQFNTSKFDSKNYHNKSENDKIKNVHSNQLIELDTNKLSKRANSETSDSESDNENPIKKQRRSSSTLNLINSPVRIDNIETSEEFEREKSFMQKYLSGSYKKEFLIDTSKMFEINLLNGKCFKCNCLLRNLDLLEHLDKKHQLTLSNLIVDSSQCFLCGSVCSDRFELIKHQLVKHDLVSFASTSKAYSFNDYTEKNKIYELIESISTNEKIFFNNKSIDMGQTWYNGRPLQELNGLQERCKICKQMFKNFDDLYIHVQSHLKKNTSRALFSSNPKDLNNNDLIANYLSNSTDCSINSFEYNEEKITKLKKCFFCDYNYYLNENYHKHLIQNHVTPFNIHLKRLCESDLKTN